MDLITIQNQHIHRYPVVISLPHSGTWLPDDMHQALLPRAILANTDWFLPALYDFLPAAGFTTLTNHVNRYAADPNRSVIVAPAGSYQRTTVYQQNTFGHPLYAAPLSLPTIEHRLAAYYHPYCTALQRLLADKIAAFGHVTLIDLHSFAFYPGQPSIHPQDIVLGSEHDQTSSKAFRLQVTAALTTAGFTVSDNYPFRGGDITRHYGQDPRVTALQIELNYRCYIGNTRRYGEEELTDYDPALFAAASRRLLAIKRLLEQIQ